MRNKAAAVLAASFLTLSLASPAQAAPPGIPDGVEGAVTGVIPGVQLTGETALQPPSDVAPDQNVRVDSAEFHGAQSVAVIRVVGAIREVTPRTVPGRLVKSAKVKRAKAGTRDVRIVAKGRLTGAVWTERTGVNYTVVLHNPVSHDDLLKIVKALPADSSKVSNKVKRLIDKAPPPRRETAERSTSNKFVDGVGNSTDDWGDEATLCNGCAYSTSNYVWLWQKVVHSDGISIGVDCIFGSGTANATKSWQRKWNLGVDGIVGPATRGWADDGTWNVYNNAVYYQGWNYLVWFQRLSQNAYYNDPGTKRMSYTSSNMC
ncbi:peptidoglycan-binding domain-containing protein [Actinocorallia sp. A-T 12471]|uniref:peptidoglycan-binding domain-containing protein n=1 Tax=Actinocorallia sp. A-T 12471 TaxID=3089813 RepID=UPI0029CDC088|nr:peptidoglycan-binding domain-containing protein [Actinocorallia sp. A-T 12471]MDX6739677.1 peptidoglycan-binding domain-containing protein [Actinocorallia sp. A-T 12471]